MHNFDDTCGRDSKPVPLIVEPQLYRMSQRGRPISYFHGFYLLENVFW